MSPAREIAAVPAQGASRLADLLALTKPRIASFVALSAFVGGLLAAGPEARLARVLEAALWVTCAAAGASAFNQVLERDTDALMKRTRGRPLPSGSLAPRYAILFGSAHASASVTGLSLRFKLLSALLWLAKLCA